MRLLLEDQREKKVYGIYSFRFLLLLGCLRMVVLCKEACLAHSTLLYSSNHTDSLSLAIEIGNIAAARPGFLQLALKSPTYYSDVYN